MTVLSLWLGLAVTTAHAQSFETVYSEVTGTRPRAGLVQGMDGDFYGTTHDGGVFNSGTVFKFTSSGVHTVLHSFDRTFGGFPYSGLVQGSDGNFYGTTWVGGVSNEGTVFKITPGGTHSVLYDMDGTNGRNPAAGLVLGNDGSFYGTTQSGGANDQGTVFKITAGGAYTVLYHFDGTSGRTPVAGLVLGFDGDFYGTTYAGGVNDEGTVYKITTSGAHTVLHSFDSTRGRYPQGALVQGFDGHFYGTAEQGGAGALGTVFQITTSGTCTLLHSFNNTNGAFPLAGLTVGVDGHFYGTTQQGGVNGEGTVFRVTASGTHTLLHSFDANQGSDPRSGLVRNFVDGSFYGVSELGGESTVGTIFQISDSGTHTLLHSFGASLGSYSADGLTQGSDGHFYGTTSSGGESDAGTVFKITASGTPTLVHSFNFIGGSTPIGGLVLDNDGSFYGTTSEGGFHNQGTVFNVAASGTQTVLHYFDGINGSLPKAGLVKGSDGDFYGTTSEGGQHNLGTVFKITASGTHTLLHSFNGTNGSRPQAGLTEGSGGNFYGTTRTGGTSGLGTVFQITPGGTHTRLHNFNGTNGSFPEAGLALGDDGNFYGTTRTGGTNGLGTVFQVTPGGIHTRLHSFNSTNGSNPQSGLVQGSDGDFYGTTRLGGMNDSGTVFKITVSGVHTRLYTFNGRTSGNPKGTLLLATDGHIYGTADQMGVWKLSFFGSNVLYSKGSAVPGAGEPGSGIPSGALWTKLGVPSINDDAHVAVQGDWKAGSVAGSGIFRSGGARSGLHLVVAKGAAVPSVTNGVMSTLNHVLLAADGAVAWTAALANAPGTTGAVNATSNLGLFLDSDGPEAGAPTLLARKGNPITAGGVNTAGLATIDSVALSTNSVAMLGKMKLQASVVTAASDQALWVYNRNTTAWRLTLREGDALMGSTVKVIGALVARTAAGGHGRGVVNNSGMDQLCVRVTLADGRMAAGIVRADGSFSFPDVVNGSAPGYSPDAVFSSLGVPVQNSAGAVSLLGTVRGSTVTTANNVAVFTEDDTTFTLTKRLTKGDLAGLSTGVFSGFKDPVNGLDNAFAVIGSMAPNPAAGISAGTNDGVWYHNGSALGIVALEGAQPVGAAAGAKWKAFTSLALPEERGPIFCASLAIGPGKVTAAKDKGLWAVTRAGVLQKLMQEGDAIGSSKVASFQAINVIPGSPAQTRSFNRAGDVVMQVTDAAGGTHLMHVGVP
ncbi:MAG: hypothetical protein JNJ83_19530 [Verrucomicrobiaceae bacterium]|nr:hypothetical protein [Verrucomicrobiaceae bacterium]